MTRRAHRRGAPPSSGGGETALMTPWWRAAGAVVGALTILVALLVPDLQHLTNTWTGSRSPPDWAEGGILEPHEAVATEAAVSAALGYLASGGDDKTSSSILSQGDWLHGLSRVAGNVHRAGSNDRELNAPGSNLAQATNRLEDVLRIVGDVLERVEREHRSYADVLLGGGMASALLVRYDPVSGEVVPSPEESSCGEGVDVAGTPPRASTSFPSSSSALFDQRSDDLARGLAVCITVQEFVARHALDNPSAVQRLMLEWWATLRARAVLDESSGFAKSTHRMHYSPADAAVKVRMQGLLTVLLAGSEAEAMLGFDPFAAAVDGGNKKERFAADGTQRAPSSGLPCVAPLRRPMSLDGGGYAADDDGKRPLWALAAASSRDLAFSSERDGNGGSGETEGENGGVAKETGEGGCAVAKSAALRWALAASTVWVADDLELNIALGVDLWDVLAAYPLLTSDAGFVDGYAKVTDVRSGTATSAGDSVVELVYAVTHLLFVLVGYEEYAAVDVVLLPREFRFLVGCLGPLQRAGEVDAVAEAVDALSMFLRFESQRWQCATEETSTVQSKTPSAKADADDEAGVAAAQSLLPDAAKARNKALAWLIERQNADGRWSGGTCGSRRGDVNEEKMRMQRCTNADPLHATLVATWTMAGVLADDRWSSLPPPPGRHRSAKKSDCASGVVFQDVENLLVAFPSFVGVDFASLTTG